MKGNHGKLVQKLLIFVNMAESNPEDRGDYQSGNGHTCESLKSCIK
jgi:hypothetical protein